MPIPSLSQTSVFKYAENLSGNKITKVISDTIDTTKGCVYVTESMLEDAFYKIKQKSFPFKAKYGVVDLFRQGIIKLVYNPKTKLTVAVPFFIYKMDSSKFGVIINITNYATIGKDGSVKIDPVVLYVLMLSGAYSLDMQSANTISTLAANGFVELFADMLVGTLTKMINIDIIHKERIKFLFAKFIYMKMYDEKRASDSARELIKYADQYTIDNVDLAFKISDFDTLESLINAMRENLTEMSTITFGLLFDRYMKTYGEPAAFAIEYIPFMVYVFCAVIGGCNAIVNTKAVEINAVNNTKKLQLLFDRIEVAVQNAANKRK